MLSEWVPGKEMDPLSFWDPGHGLWLMEAPKTDSGFVWSCFFIPVSHTDITFFPLYLHENVWELCREARGPSFMPFSWQLLWVMTLRAFLCMIRARCGEASPHPSTGLCPLPPRSVIFKKYEKWFLLVFKYTFYRSWQLKSETLSLFQCWLCKELIVSFWSLSPHMDTC